VFWMDLIPRVGTLYWWFRRNRIEAVNAHYPGLWLLPVLLSRWIFRCPRVVVISLHGLDLQAAKRTSGVERWLWLRLFTGADRIVACSEALAEETRAAFPRVAGKVEAVTNGIDVSRVRACAQPPEEVVELRRKGRMYIACVATFELKKGQDVLLEAFARLSGVWTDVDLVIAGRTGDQLEALRTQADRLCISDRVYFLPDLQHGEAQAVIRDAVLFALPSRYEPFGIVILEAAVHRVPVVASAVGGVPEIIPDERFGRLVPSDDAVALEEAISGVLSQPGTAEDLAVSLERRVHEHFTWQRAAFRYLEIAGQHPKPNDG
jgi:glycosyltransferase involved in cell wall biosynthesis